MLFSFFLTGLCLDYKKQTERQTVGMEGNWSSNERSNVRRRALKKVDDLIQSIDTKCSRQESETLESYAEGFSEETSIWFEEELLCQKMGEHY